MIKRTTIGIRGAEFVAYHGYYPAERLYGHTFVIDLQVTLYQPSTTSESLADTVDYASLYAICAREMSTTQQLLETVLYRIIKKIKALPLVAGGTITISKRGAQLGGKIDAATVEMEF